MDFKKVAFFIFISCLTLNPHGLFAEDKKGAAFLEDDELSQALMALDEDAPPSAPVDPARTQAPAVSSPALAKPQKAVNSPVSAIKPAADDALQEEENDLPASVTQFGAIQKKNKSRESLSSESYRMLDNVAEITPRLLNASRDIEAEGNWFKDHFEFSGFPGAAIQVRKFKFPTEDRDAVSVKILPGHIYQLRFEQVPPFSNLKLEYNLSDSANTKTPSYMFFRIMAGKYELKRLQVSSKDPWIKQNLKMGVISFLNEPIPITFEFATSQATGLTFSFIPEAD